MYLPRPLIIAGGAVILVLAAVAAFLALADGDDKAPALKSYYYEARIEIAEQEDTSPLGVRETRPDLIRVWYEAPDKWRQEFTFSDPKQRDLGSVHVSDGQRIWQYDGQVNSYYVQDLPSDPASRGAIGTIFSFFLLGPLPAQSIEEFFGRYQSQSWSFEIVRGERLLGRDVNVVELRKRGVSNESTYWIDPRYLFVLRYEAGTKGVSEQWVRAEVTDLQYDPKVEAERFEFKPPAGAKEVQPPSNTGSSSGSSSIGGRDVTVPDGFLTPAYLPEGYVSVGQGTSNSSGRLASVHMRFQPGGGRAGGGPYLLIEEQKRYGGLPESFKTGQPVSVSGADAYLSANDGVNKLVMWMNDIVITLTADALPPAELIRIAESLR